MNSLIGLFTVTDDSKPVLVIVLNIIVEVSGSPVKWIHLLNRDKSPLHSKLCFSSIYFTAVAGLFSPFIYWRDELFYAHL